MAKTVNNVKVNTTFTTATAREQLTSGENLCTSLGKVNKYLVDLDAGAFAFPANGGNADTLDGLHSTNFSQIISFGNTETDTKTAIGIQYKSTTYWCSNWTDYPSGLQDGQGMIIAINYKGSGTAGTNAMWTRQIFISPHITSSNTSTNIYQRSVSNTNVTDWVNISDGGNASTLDGKHASDFTLSYIRNSKPLVTSILTLETGARLTWLPVDGATKYAVSLYINGIFDVQSKEITSTYYDIQGLTPGTVYLALVQAYVNGSWSTFTTGDLVHFYTMPVASPTSDGLVTIGTQHFKGQKFFDDNVYIPNPNIVLGNGAPSEDTARSFVITDSTGSTSIASASLTNVARANGNNELYLSMRSLTNKAVLNCLVAKINANGTNYYTMVTNPVEPAKSALRNLSSGSATPQTKDSSAAGYVSSGSWYGKHD